MEEVAKEKKRYSIRSLMMIMTLLAVWLAIPRAGFSFDTWYVLFVIVHQFAFWGLASTLIWMLSGKRRAVLWAEISFILILWGPLLLVFIESCFSRTNNWVVRSVLDSVGLFNMYGELYDWIFKAFGYGPSGPGS